MADKISKLKELANRIEAVEAQHERANGLNELTERLQTLEQRAATLDPIAGGIVEILDRLQALDARVGDHATADVSSATGARFDELEAQLAARGEGLAALDQRLQTLEGRSADVAPLPREIDEVLGRLQALDTRLTDHAAADVSATMVDASEARFALRTDRLDELGQTLEGLERRVATVEPVPSEIDEVRVRLQALDARLTDHAASDVSAASAAALVDAAVARFALRTSGLDRRQQVLEDRTTATNSGLDELVEVFECLQLLDGRLGALNERLQMLEQRAATVDDLPREIDEVLARLGTLDARLTDHTAKEVSAVSAVRVDQLEEWFAEALPGEQEGGSSETPDASRPANFHEQEQPHKLLESGSADPNAPQTQKSSSLRSGRRRIPKAREWLIVVALALGGAFLLRSFVVEAFYVPSGSMFPTLQIGDRILVNRLPLSGGSIRRGDVIVFRRVPKDNDPTNSADLVKRVIGLPGEVIFARGDHVLINGHVLSEPWLPKAHEVDARWGCAQRAYDIPPTHIASNSYFVMGDCRGNSSDSRFWGVVPRSYIVGKVFVVVWRNNHPWIHWL